ncbi:hypothetical protein NHX12_016508 [Muraenolepis orangiensis]|uniref:C-type lectin domain-containing protein n=1 Tax=Muraenolepis orangiensis TaxID=630683 RepID=A0A9Q0I3F4_9TELE|nr:hypothetical protein NHX12_016508 [Muraenolepis orangiensis]
MPSLCAPYRQHCLVETPKTWFAARDYCRARGFDLATIDDMGAMESLRSLIADKIHDEWWIGLKYDGQGAAWHWSLADKEFYKEGERSYSPLKERENDIVAIYDKVWSTRANTGWYIMCYDGTTKKVRVLRVKVRSEDLQDLNDPATKAAILKQTKQLLEDATLISGLKMTWTTNSDGQVFTKEQCQEEDCDL